ncbi:MAG: YceI family protein [Pseudomonadota bacterium]|nr:YceI family protein [Pseudomonadota bacterium]
MKNRLLANPVQHSVQWLSVALIFLLVSLLAGCLPKPALLPEITAQTPGGFPTERYQAGYAPGGKVYRLDPAQSEALIYVYRGGRLAHLGHNHVVMSRSVQGYLFLADDLTASRLDLFVPLDALIVDDSQQRTAAGEDFSTKPTPDAVDGTRRNMLGERGLNAVSHPFVAASVKVTGGTLPNVDLDAALTIHGFTRNLPLHAAVKLEYGRAIASGEFSLRQTDFGMQPYSVLGGALVVQDEIRIRFRLVAEAMEDKK